MMIVVPELYLSFEITDVGGNTAYCAQLITVNAETDLFIRR
ncbi:MAG: hypothetical protein R2771_07400 [Saprospiraceae bacterium]